jgi:hypothetical protein
MRSLKLRDGLLAIALLFALAAPAIGREPTTRAAAPAVEFLDQDSATKAIVDETMEPYFKLLQPMEMSVKTAEPIGQGTLDEQRDRCRQRYQAAVQNFSAEEQDALRWYVSKLEPLVEKDYPLYAHTPWSFIKLNAKFEGGMPHTRGSHIVLSGQFLKGLIQSRAKGPEWMSLAQFGDVLLHEQSHVVQRENPGQFAKLFAGLWKFKHAGMVQGCDWITQHQLVNPDGVDVNWVFPIKDGDTTRWIWPLVVFGDVDDANKATFADMQMVAIDLEAMGVNSFKAKVGADGKPVMHELMSLAEYVSVFWPSQNIYHPNEAAADLFAKIVVIHHVAPGNIPAERQAGLQKLTAQLQPLDDWFKKILAAAR